MRAKRGLPLLLLIGIVWMNTGCVRAETATTSLLSTDKGHSPVAGIADADYITAQIRPWWNVDVGAIGAQNLVVRVKIQITPDGTVTEAKLDVDEARYASDNFYRAAADSARRAVLSASPLKTPPGKPDFFKTYASVTLNFNPKDIAR